MSAVEKLEQEAARLQRQANYQRLLADRTSVPSEKSRCYRQATALCAQRRALLATLQVDVFAVG